MLLTGMTYSGIAVFDFGGIMISGANINVTGADPLAVLSQGDALFAGSGISLDGSVNGNNAAGPGGYAGGGTRVRPATVPAAVAASVTPEGAEEALGTEEAPVSAGSNGGSGASGGQPYGNLANQLVGGSGGGISYLGGGGGAGPSSWARRLAHDQRRLHRRSGGLRPRLRRGWKRRRDLPARRLRQPRRCAGCRRWRGRSGGGGGGGQILILANSYTATGAIDLAGGTSGYGRPGANGMITQAGLPVPEPSAIFLLASALPAAAWVWRKAPFPGFDP